MRNVVAVLIGACLFFLQLLAVTPRRSEVFSSTEFAQLLKVDTPVVLCIDDKPGAGGQPSGQAYARAAANGYRSILTLRYNKDGVDPAREQLMDEQHRMRYFNIPVAAKLPRPQQVDQFLLLVRDKANHPMLVNCAFAERVAPFMMIFRITEQGWSEEKAIEEASRSGLKGEELKKFARDYLARMKKAPAIH